MTVAHALRQLGRVSFAALALFLATVSAGVPELIEIACGVEEAPCSSPCDQAGDDNRCSPLCHAGACAKIAATSISSVVLLVEHQDMPDLSDEDDALTVERSLAPPSGVAESIFHPPRV